MIPAAALTIVTAGGVTLAASYYDATERYAVTAEYVGASGGISVRSDGATPRIATDYAIDALVCYCHRAAAEFNAGGDAVLAAVWRHRADLLRDLHREVLAAWPESAEDMAAEVAS